jgi:uncharacterized peroxidase-related enzyme
MAYANLIELFRAFPEASKPLIEYHEVVLRGPSPFTDAERELIAGFVSTLNGCGYCTSVHVAAAENMGAPAGQIARLAADPDLEDADARMRPVLHCARKLTERPASVTQDDVDAIAAAGWEPSALFYLASVSALFNFMNRLVEGMRIHMDPVYAPMAARRLAEHGYLPLLDLIRKQGEPRSTPKP